MKKILLVVLASIFSVSLIVSCGGGGGGDDYSGFVESDFSGKFLYYTSDIDDFYQLWVFYADGTAQDSGFYTSGLPVLQPELAQWEIVNGELVIYHGSDKVKYRLVSDDTLERVFIATKYDKYGNILKVYLFYDQVTGRQQAQDFINQK